jgi:hypothetical protein
VALKKKKEKIVNVVSHTLAPSKKRTLRASEFPKVEAALYKWFLK